MTVEVPLMTGELTLADNVVRASAPRWIKSDGETCRRGEVIAYRTLRIERVDGAPSAFAGEQRDLQVGFRAPASGRLVHAFADQGWQSMIAGPHAGTWQDVHLGSVWTDDPSAALPLSPMFFTGRRQIEAGGIMGHFTSGWHDRARAWWGSAATRPFESLLSLGICDLLGLIRGASLTYQDLADTLEGPMHASYVADDFLVPAAPVLRTQIERNPARTDAAYAALARVLAEEAHRAAAVGEDAVRALGADAIMLQLLVKQLCSVSPVLEGAPIVADGRILDVGPPRNVLLSLAAEGATLLRHKTDGHYVAFHAWRARDVGPVTLGYLRSEFEQVKRSVDEIRADYEALIDSLQERAGAHVIVLNLMSTMMIDPPDTYAPFPLPLGGMARRREMNEMLSDLARARDISVVDIDAIVAEVGAIHNGGSLAHPGVPIERVAREELAHILARRRAA